jgi:hypothetical protein
MGKKVVTDHIVISDKIELWPVDDLIPYERNARTHSNDQVAQISRSIEEFGFTNPILIGGDSGIIAGHGRLMAARKLGLKRVPVVILDHLTLEQRRAYVIADNKLALNAGWDADLLAAELSALELDGFDVSLTGFSDQELAEICDGLGGEKINRVEPDEPKIDQLDDLQEAWCTKSGQVWKIGAHTLVVGDCREVDLPDGDMFFDPPWEIISSCHAPKSGSMLAFCDGQRQHDVIERFGAPTWIFVWDCVSSWYTPNRPLRRSKLCLWYGGIADYDFNGSHYGDAGESRVVSNTRGSYEFSPDPRGKHLSDVFSQPITQLHSNSEHSHSKPLDWVRMLVGNCTSGRIIDPYAGSGIAMVACQQLGRECFSVEMDPKYAALILEQMRSMGIDGVLCES